MSTLFVRLWLSNLSSLLHPQFKHAQSMCPPTLLTHETSSRSVFELTLVHIVEVLL